MVDKPSISNVQPSTVIPLSAVIISCNAATQLPACLQSLAFCSEILVVDSCSMDATIDLASNAGARVIETHWRGFGPQKQFAVEQATHDWVLCIDADERVSPELADSIRAVLPALTFPAYRFARCNRFMGRYLRHGEGYPDWSLRLFDRRHARWSADAVHERVIAEGAVGTLAGDLLHDSAESIESYLEKQNRYSTLAAETALAMGKRGSVMQLLLSPLVRFLKFYFLRRGFLDGVPGLVHILIGCHASFAKHAKILAARTSAV
ncbi:MAG: glycosyltransferase family 2 protein [Pseudomonadota bacterium]